MYIGAENYRNVLSDLYPLFFIWIQISKIDRIIAEDFILKLSLFNDFFTNYKLIFINSLFIKRFCLIQKIVEKIAIVFRWKKRFNRLENRSCSDIKPTDLVCFKWLNFWFWLLNKFIVSNFWVLLRNDERRIKKD